MSYSPYYVCKHCGTEVYAVMSFQNVTSPAVSAGVQPLCSCEDAWKAHADESRLKAERRKAAKRKLRRGK